MMPRDFWRTGRWHSLQPNDPGAFYITAGPTIADTTVSSFQVQWYLSDFGSGYIDYSTTEAYVGTVDGDVSIADATLTFDHHDHIVTGLAAATTYYYRVRSVNAAGQTTTSAIRSVVTEGVAPPVDPDLLGPRYDFYGAGASGNFPAWPSGAGVVYVPASYAASGDGSALAAWINAQADGSTIVFDSSSGGTAGYGPGTLYTLDDPIRFDSRVLGVKSEKSLTLWGYNTRMTWANKDLVTVNGYANDWLPGLFVFKYGGWKDCQVLGFELQGANTRGGEWDCRTASLGFNEQQCGIYLFAHQGMTIQDCWVHHIGGSCIYASPWDPNRADMYVFSGATWWNADLTIKNNRLERTGSQNVNIKICDGLDVSYNIISRTAIYPVNFERGCYDPYPAGYRRHRSYSVTYNRIEYPTCLLSTTAFYKGPCISMNLDAYQESATDWVITDNEFEGGHFGRGNPTAEIAVLGAAEAPLPQVGHAIWATPPYSENLSGGIHPAVMSNLTFSRNVMRFPVDQLTKGFAAGFSHWNGLIVQDNEMQNIPMWFYNTSNETVSGNNAVIVDPHVTTNDYANNSPTPP